MTLSVWLFAASPAQSQLTKSSSGFSLLSEQPLKYYYLIQLRYVINNYKLFLQNVFIETQPTFWELNWLNLIGVAVSTTGLGIAIYQIRKLSNRTKAIEETYTRAINDLENRETISNMSTVLQKIESLKSNIRNNKLQDSVNELSTIAKLLVAFENASNVNFSNFSTENYTNLCNELQLKLITQEEVIDRSQLKNEIILLNELELKLTSIQSKLRFSKEN